MQIRTRLLKWGAVAVVLFALAALVISEGPLPAHADSGKSCQLSWAGTGVMLYMGSVTQDVQSALSGAHLTNCTDQSITSCTLVQGGGNTVLNYDNIASTSGVLIQNLQSDNIGLDCNSVGSGGPTPQRVDCSTFDAGQHMLKIVTDNGANTDCFAGDGILPVKLYNVSTVQLGSASVFFDYYLGSQHTAVGFPPNTSQWLNGTNNLVDVVTQININY